MDSTTVSTLFPGLGDRIYCNTASMGPGLAASVDALHAAADGWGRGALDWLDAERATEEVRGWFAELVGASADAVAIIPTTSTVAGLVATHVDRRYRGDGNIVVGAQEFSSNFYPWLGLEARGFEVRTVPFTDGAPDEAALLAAVDGRTRLLAVSAVQSASGYRADLARLRAGAPDALLFVDAAQAAGSVALDMDALGIDALATPNHKFLLGVRGFGYGAFSDRLRDAMDPVWPGWRAAVEPTASFYGPAMPLSPTASRFDQSIAWTSALVERVSMGTLRDLGFARVAEHDARLASRLRAGLRDAGVPFVDHGEAHGSAIVSCAPTAPDAAERMAEAGIVAALRAGRVRIALHVCNTEAHVDRLIEVLAA